ncbi:hypothetical protein ECANGB1_1571 [Enterospora canceri]|uniref:Uncharacterized protein n=1 Tax=Enterospora canceri TaxID=1081671 RepID=A0A1Y1S5T5_9MICR|nr:hypothetical protein ECANGB1_1571 [Enterospora canceri]
MQTAEVATEPVAAGESSSTESSDSSSKSQASDKSSIPGTLVDLSSEYDQYASKAEKQLDKTPGSKSIVQELKKLTKEEEKKKAEKKKKRKCDPSKYPKIPKGKKAVIRINYRPA